MLVFLESFTGHCLEQTIKLFCLYDYYVTMDQWTEDGLLKQSCDIARYVATGLSVRLSLFQALQNDPDFWKSLVILQGM